MSRLDPLGLVVGTRGSSLDAGLQRGAAPAVGEFDDVAAVRSAMLA